MYLMNLLTAIVQFIKEERAARKMINEKGLQYYLDKNI